MDIPGIPRTRGSFESADFSADYIDSRGRKQPCFKLDHYHVGLQVIAFEQTIKKAAR